jgi:DNA processing protein
MTDLNTGRDRAARFLLSHLTEPGDAHMNQLVESVGAENAWLFVSQVGSEPASVSTEALKRWRPRIQRSWTLEWAIDERIRQIGRGIRFIIPSDEAWPNGLADLGYNAPLGLFVRGDVSQMTALNLMPSVAVVGARAATSYGEHVTGELVAELARTHLIVSGAAYGIDGQAHRVAIAAGGKTIAFLAGGVDRPYPAGHANLIERITVNGAVVSEIPPGSTPTRWRFLQRNRLIAAASQGLVVVEAGYRSGSLNAAGHARSLGRRVMAVPGPVTSAASAGCHRLLTEGATLITDAADVRAALSINEGVTL